MIVTRGLGESNKLITRGFGKKLVVIVDEHTGGGGYWSHPHSVPIIDLDYIRTATIRIRDRRPITVDVISITKEQIDQVRVQAKLLGYTDCEILSKEEVEFL